MTEIRTAISPEIDRFLDSLVRTGPFASKAELVRAALVSYAGEAGPMAQGFDKENIVSPDGRVYQLEYARESALRGMPGVGLVYEGGVVLAAVTAGAKLVRGITKIHRIGKDAAVLASGLVADAFMAVAHARRAEPRTTEELVEALVGFYWGHTVYRWKRPLGAALLVASALGGNPRLFEIDPSGAFVEYDAAAIGEGSKDRTEALEKRYRRGKAADAEKLALDVLGKPAKANVVHVRA